MDELAQAIDAHHAHITEAGTLEERRGRNLRNEVLGLAAVRLRRELERSLRRRPKRAGVAGQGRAPRGRPGERGGRTTEEATMSKAMFQTQGDLGELVIADPPLNLVDLDLANDLQAAVGRGGEMPTPARSSCAPRATTSPQAQTSRCSSAGDEQVRARAARRLRGHAAAVRSARCADASCATQGLCLAAGFELALSVLTLIVGERRLQPRPGRGRDRRDALRAAGHQRLTARAGAGRALEAVLTGRPYPAATMMEWGVVNRVLPKAELESKARSFAERLAAGPTVAHGATKRIGAHGSQRRSRRRGRGAARRGRAGDGERGPAVRCAHPAGRGAGQGEVRRALSSPARAR